MVGQFVLALALTSPVFLFSQLSLRAVQVTDARGDHAFSDYLTLRLITTCAAVIAIVVATLSFGFSGRGPIVILLVVLAKGLDSITDVIFGQWQRLERLDAVSLVFALNGLSSLIGLSFALHLTGNLIWATAAYAAGSALALCMAAFLNSSIVPGGSLRPRWRVAPVWQLTKLAFPLGPVMLLVTLNLSIPPYFVALHLGNRELGIFAALSYVVIVGTTLVNALGQALSPRLAREYAAGNAAGFLRVLRNFAVFAAVLGACGLVAVLVAGRTVLTLMYSPEYGDAAGVMAVMMGAGALGYIASTLGYALTATRRFSIQVPRALFVAATTTVACAVLVPRFGIAGAAWACAIGGAAEIFGSAWLIFTSVRRVCSLSVYSE
jgi:O-antigen/teichoic acid export membrane protein